MFIIRCFVLTLVLTCFNGFNVWAAENSAPPASYNFFTHDLKLSSEAFKIARLQYLPDLKDSETGWSGTSIPTPVPVTQDCSAYPLTGCPTGWVCDKCPYATKFKKISCAKGYQKSGDNCTKIPDFCTGSGEYKNIPTDHYCTTTTTNPSCNTAKGTNCDKCYSSCSAISCGSYPLDCNTINKSQLHISQTESCPNCSGSANCAKAYCKITQCADGYKISNNGSACIELNDECENGYYKSCETGTTGDPKYTEKGTACYQCKPPAANCEAPYYRNNENKCVLWDGAAALVKTCSELITTTKNQNITGNILVWGTLDCKENAIKLSTGQNLIGKGYFSGKYPEASDSATNKFSKITWDFTSKIADALTLEHNSMVSDLTLEIKSNMDGKWSSPIYLTPVLLDAGAKENLILKNMDLYADLSAADNKSVTMIEAPTAKISLQGKNSIRFKNSIASNGSYSYVKNSSTYITQNGTINIGKDALLDVQYIDGGSNYGFIDTNLNMTDNAKFTFNATADIYADIFDTASSLQYNGQKIVLKGTSNITVNAPKQYRLSDGIPIHMSENSVINLKGSGLMSGDYKNGTAAENALVMNDNSIANVKGTVSGGILLNDSATLRVNSDKISALDSGKDITLNNNSKFIIKQETTTTPDNYATVYYSRKTHMNGNSKLYIKANRNVFRSTGFDLASATAKVYINITDASQKIFGGGFSNPEVWLYKTVANAPFYIETPGQKGYNNAEDDGLYLMPALGVSANDNASTCSHMTGSYSSSKINRDLACWTLEKDANPNNNDYFKGKQCNRCSDGYKLTGVTYVPSSDSRFTTTKSDFDKEMTALTNAMNF